ncbi:MAG: GspH/FimT family pseudopilin [Gammaproteobacteria bacterium]|nr:GspH/FimT family pseudopilin [Gammaproteobacteria bacterium]MBU6510075.1 GspH/FimT family pseudopilin [Gammaproteobacteria bacterium]MDE1983637.1 GspH/FimT family pseudopilin [Gammaproteobacteria bacterium]MDE2108815.1 GspH/FimT family pseudopilin [Gammaproteobacteria bacterium]MDE2461691.1 GspH/FimT family pseudopilin [Gammaproteobacteria bacterium]
MNAHKGFTLIEFVVMAAVIAILATVALPNFAATIESNRELSEIGTLTAALALARDTATRSGSDVLVCASANGRDCADTAWNQGYAVEYLTPPPRTGAIIRSFPALDTHSSLLSSVSNHRIVFHANGMTNLAGLTTFTLCGRRGVNYARALDLLVSGLTQASTTLGQDVNGQPLVCS